HGKLATYRIRPSCHIARGTIHLSARHVRGVCSSRCVTPVRYCECPIRLWVMCVSAPRVGCVTDGSRRRYMINSAALRVEPMSAQQQVEEPFVSPSARPREITPKGVVLGVVLAAVLAGANAYLGLKVGLTVSAS